MPARVRAPDTISSSPAAESGWPRRGPLQDQEDVIVRGWLGALRGEVGRQAHEEAIRDRDDALVAAFAFGDEQPSFTGSDIAESKAEDHAGCANACFLANTDADSRAGRGHGPFALPPARVLPLHRRQVRSGMSITWQNLALDMPASTRITSRSSKGPAGPSADFLHTRISTAASPNAWVRSATSASKLLLTGRGTRLPRRQRGLTGLKEVCLPPADGLLADHLSPGGLRDRHLADDHAQHDPGLLLSRDPGGGLPMYLTLRQDRLNCPATKSDARQQHPSFTVPRDDYDPKNVTHDSTHPVRGASVCCPLPGVR